MEDKGRIVCAVLHLRDASDAIRDLYPDLSTTLLQAAEVMVSDAKISSDDLDELDSLAKEISEDA